MQPAAYLLPENRSLSLLYIYRDTNAFNSLIAIIHVVSLEQVVCVLCGFQVDQEYFTVYGYGFLKPRDHLLDSRNVFV